MLNSSENDEEKSDIVNDLSQTSLNPTPKKAKKVSSNGQLKKQASKKEKSQRSDTIK